MLHDFELHELFHSPKNVLLKALLYLNISRGFVILAIFQCRNNSLNDSTYIAFFRAYLPFKGLTYGIDQNIFYLLTLKLR